MEHFWSSFNSSLPTIWSLILQKFTISSVNCCVAVHMLITFYPSSILHSFPSSKEACMLTLWIWIGSLLDLKVRPQIWQLSTGDIYTHTQSLSALMTSDCKEITNLFSILLDDILFLLPYDLIKDNVFNVLVNEVIFVRSSACIKPNNQTNYNFFFILMTKNNLKKFCILPLKYFFFSTICKPFLFQHIKNDRNNLHFFLDNT